VRTDTGSQGQTVVVLDTCFSGREGTGSALVPGLQPLVPQYSIPVSTGIVLSAGRGDEFAGPLPGTSRPAFSYLLLGALRGWGDLDSDGAVTAEEALLYTRGVLVELVRTRRQTPQMTGSDPSFVLSMGRERGPDLVAMVLAGGDQGSAGVGDYETAEHVVETTQHESDEVVAEAQPEEGYRVEEQEDGDASTPAKPEQALDSQRWLEGHAGDEISPNADLDGGVLERFGYAMVRIEPGDFTMGSPRDEDGRDDDEAQHRVQLTQPFLIGVTEVTQDLYAEVMGANPSYHEGPRLPVERVNFADAAGFCNALSEMGGLTPAYQIEDDSVTWDRSADGYRLPTEAEWEYASRGGGEHVYSGSDFHHAVAWTYENSRDRTHDVGGKKANGYGLQDMSGNVWEWVWDWYRVTPEQGSVDPAGARGGFDRTCKGGAYDYAHSFSRVAKRMNVEPHKRSTSRGFRCVRSVP